MMASYILLYVVCVILCTVHSYNISGRITYNNGAVHAVNILDSVSGENWINTRVLTLDRSEGTDSPPTLTLANFTSITKLELINIGLERVPVFVNTNCSYITITGNKIKSVPANAFSVPRPAYLELNNNEIHSMADTSVNIGARYVYLSCNKLSHFSESWFEDPGSIESLNFDGNRIEHIQDRAFQQMTKLHWLYLSYNRITSIGSEAFSSGIRVLYLQFNDIVQLSVNMFVRPDIPMEFLFLHHNQLSYLPEALLLHLKPSYISLFGNPWQCQCLRDIERWLRELNATRYDIAARRAEPVCVVPLSFQTVCIPVVDKQLQHMYTSGLSPVQGCWANPCPCSTDDIRLAALT